MGVPGFFMWLWKRYKGTNFVFDKSKLSQLRQQEKTKMIKAWLKGMRDKGIVDDANRILDKDAYTKEWADAKVDIEAKVKAIN